MGTLTKPLSILVIVLVPITALGQTERRDSTKKKLGSAEPDTTVGYRVRGAEGTDSMRARADSVQADSVQADSIRKDTTTREAGAESCVEETDRFTGKRTVVCKAGPVKHDDSNVTQDVSGPKTTLLKSSEKEGFLVELVAGATSPVLRKAKTAYFLVDGDRDQVPVETKAWKKQDRVQGRVKKYVVEEVRFVLGTELSDQIQNASEVSARIGGWT
jgi:hypothetical protein